MASKLQKKNGKWTFRYLNKDGVQKRYICKSLVYQDAEEERIDFVYSRNALKDKKNPEKILWTDFCLEFLKYVKRTKKGYETYFLHIRNFDNAIKIKYLSETTTKTFNDYIDIRSNIVSKSTINREINTFRCMFTWAIDIEDYALKHPFKKKIFKFKTKHVVKERVFSEKEVATIFLRLESKTDKQGNTLPITDEERDMIVGLLHCGLYAGLRLKEAENLKKSHVYMEERSILVEPHKTSETDPDPAIIPLATKLKQHCMATYIKYPKEEYVVPNIETKERLSRSARISHLIIDTLRAIGIEKAGMHTCRHTFISNYANNAKIDSADIMDYARIKSIDILKKYRHITPENHRKNIDMLTY